MSMKNLKKEIFTIPNLLSLFRLVLIPVYISLYMNAEAPWEYLTAGGVLALSCLTDLADGKIARHFNMISTLGKILDPVADKLTQFTLVLCLSLKYPVLNPVLALFVVKELFQMVVGIFHLCRGRMLPGALMAGKVCTTVLFISLTALVLFPTMPPAMVNLIALTDGVFLLISFLSYIFAYFGKHKKVTDLKQD
ncbi:MAG: CDP-alcohol phosphatidyltransferase family protein [Eubacteriales bacterium]|nr:CDP-alcohol phosphatidyltransferase family protein [Eubacteriales bacterium]